MPGLFVYHFTIDDALPDRSETYNRHDIQCYMIICAGYPLFCKEKEGMKEKKCMYTRNLNPYNNLVCFKCNLLLLK